MWYLPFSGGNSAPGSLEIQLRKVDVCRLNSPSLPAQLRILALSPFDWQGWCVSLDLFI